MKKIPLGSKILLNIFVLFSVINLMLEYKYNIKLKINVEQVLNKHYIHTYFIS